MKIVMFKSKMIRTAAVLSAVTFMAAGCGKDNEQQSAYRQYGITCLQEARYGEAVEYFQKALDESIGKVSDMECDICYYKAEAQYRNGDTEGAIDTYTAIINYNGDAKAYYLRGCLYYSIGTDEQRVLGDKDFEAAVREEPEDYELYIGIYEALSGSREALEYLQKGLEIDGDEPEDHMQKGRICYLLGENENAKELLEQAVKEGEVQANLYLTEVYHALGETEAAEQSFQTYLNSDFVDADGLYNIGLAQMKAGEYGNAIQCFESALQLDKVPDRQAIERSQIVACEYSGDFKKAKKLMKAYHKAYPEDHTMDNERIFLETR